MGDWLPEWDPVGDAGDAMTKAAAPLIIAVLLAVFGLLVLTRRIPLGNLMATWVVGGGTLIGGIAILMGWWTI